MEVSDEDFRSIVSMGLFVGFGVGLAYGVILVWLCYNWRSLV